MRLGLQGRFSLAVGVGLVLLGTLLYLGWRTQEQGYEQLAAVSSAAMDQQAQRNLARRGQAMAELLADALTNPVYFVDLEAIGDVARSALRQPDIDYILVFDAQGRVLHDGSADIAAFGQSMRDEFAPAARAATSLLVQESDVRIDVTQPLFLGEDKLGGVRIGLSRKDDLAAVAAARETLQLRARELAAERARALALPTAGLLLLAFAGTWLVGRMLVRPVRQLAAQARAM
ncbi:MAG TPA: hypothetical protein VFL14_00870, partial [Xanthomonadales bacterium]|nr:hypothetical protein [Xanthomonadales bacterium]